MKQDIYKTTLLSIISLMLTMDLHAALLKEAKVTRIVNDVDLIESGDLRRDARTNDIMRDDMVLATGHKSRAELRFTDDTLARIGANSFFTFTEGTRNMELGKGTMLLKVPKGAGGAKVSTQSVTAAITGTTVLLETNPGGPVMLKSGDPIPTPEADADLRALGLGNYVNPSIFNTAGRPVPKKPKMLATNIDYSSQEIQVAAVSGSVRVMRPGEVESTPLNSGESIPVGSFVFTQGDGVATLSPAQGIVTRITPSSTVRVKELEVRVNRKTKIEYELKEGSILSALGQEKGKEVDYKIKTAQGVVAARGTVIGTTSQNGQTGVFGGHGTITFDFGGKQEIITPGKFKNFIGQGNNIQIGTDLPTNSPQFQLMMQQTILLVQQAAENGLVRPGLPNDVRSALQNAGIQVPEVQPQPMQGATPTEDGNARNNNETRPAPQPVAQRRGGRSQGGFRIDGNKKAGFSKMIVLEGKMRVYLNDRLGESMIIEPGQMIILNPNANRLPQPVDVNLQRLTDTSSLVNGFKENEDGSLPDGGSDPIKRDPKFVQALEQQNQKLESGELQRTPLRVFGNRVGPDRTEERPERRRPDIFNAKNTDVFKKPIINPNKTIINQDTRIVGAPPELNADGKNLKGSIYRPNSGLTLAEFAFENGQNSVDQAVSVDGGGPAAPGEESASIFKFKNLELAGNPEITQGSVNGISPESLGLIGFNDVKIFGMYGPNRGLGLPLSVFIVSENGGIDFNSSTFGPLNNSLAFYARNGDINMNGAGFGIGPLARIKEALFAALGNVNMDVDSQIFADFASFQSVSGNLNLNGSVTAKTASFSSPAAVDLTSLGALNVGDIKIASGANPILPAGLGVNDQELHFGFANTGLLGTYTVSPVSFNTGTSETSIQIDNNNVIFGGNFSHAPSLSANSELEIGTNRDMDINALTISETNTGGTAELRLNAGELNTIGGATLSASGGQFTELSLNASQNINIDDATTVTSNSLSNDSRLKINSGNSIFLGTNLGSGSTVANTATMNAITDLNAGGDVFIQGSTGTLTTGSASGANNTFNVNAGDTFKIGTGVNVQTLSMTNSNTNVMADMAQINGTLNTSSSGNAQSLIETQNGIQLDGGTVQAINSLSGPAQNTLRSNGTGDIDIRDGSQVVSQTLANPTSTITTTRLDNRNGQVIVGTPAGTGATVKAQDGGTNLNNRPTIFIDATQGVQINNSSQLRAILSAGANGSGLIRITNNGSGDIIIAESAIIEAGEGIASSSVSQITVENMTGNVSIGDTTNGATLTANQITANALGSGTLKIYGGSALNANQQATLFAANATNGIQFVNNGNATITINSPNVLMRAPTIGVDTGLTVNVGQAGAGDVLNIQANNKNWSAANPNAAQRGDIVFNTTTVPNTNGPGVGASGGNFNVSNF